MGDGATAVILTRVDEDSTDSPALLAAAMETWPEGAALTEIRGGGTTLPAALSTSITAVGRSLSSTITLTTAGSLLLPESSVTTS